MAAKEAAIALLTGELADANSTAEGAHASAAQAAATIELLTAACDNLHNDITRLTAERVRFAEPSGLSSCISASHVMEASVQPLQ